MQPQVTRERSDGVGALGADQQQYLTFRLGDEEYGIEILRVQEIKGFTAVTPIPNTPPEVRGVMNLRGIVVPILDLRIRFGLRETGTTRFTVVVVVNVGERVIGLVVDAVSDVLAVPPEAIEPAPDLGGGSNALTGLAKSGDRLVALLDVGRIVECATALAAA